MQLRYVWQSYIDYGQIMNIEKNNFIYHQGEKGTGFYYLSKGLIMNSIFSLNGFEHSVNYITEGMLFGEPGIQKYSYIASSRAIKPSIIYYFSNESLNKIFKKFPIARLEFTKALLYKHHTLNEIMMFSDASAEQKLAHFTIKLDKEIGEMIPFTQTNFAHFVGLSRKTVNYIINKWRENNIISITDDKLKILNKSKLKEIRTFDKELNINIDYFLSLHSELQKERL